MSKQTSREREDQYIINESQEISFGESLLLKKFFLAFPALKHKNYQLYFFGQLVSLIGMWLQRVTQGWLIFQLTNSAYWVGVVSAISLLPILFLSLLGGVIVDRFRKKRVLYVTQFLSMVLAFLLGLITFYNKADIVNISILAFLLGIVDAIDKPARQSFVIEMVGKEDLTSAIALNSGIFNAARVIGPAFAGIIIGILGTAWAFLLNAVSFLPILLALFYISIHEVLPKTHPHPFKAIREALLYSTSNKIIRDLLIFSGIVSVFGWSHTTILPVIAERTFHAGASGLGILFAASGAGAIIGTIIISVFAKKILPMRFVAAGTILFVIPITIFAFTSSMNIGLFLLFISGGGLLIQFAVINSTVQYFVPNNMRGRVMSLYVLMAIGTLPIGSYQIGLIAEKFGTGTSLVVNALILATAGIFMFLQGKYIDKEYLKIKST